MSNKHIERSYTKVGFRQRDIFKQVMNDKNVTETAKSLTHFCELQMQRSNFRDNFAERRR